MVKKIVISPDNKKAIALFEELSKRKKEFQKKLKEKVSHTPSNSSKKEK